MNGRFSGTCFSDLEHKNGAAAQVDYSPTFATAPFDLLLFTICLILKETHDLTRKGI